MKSSRSRIALSKLATVLRVLAWPKPCYKHPHHSLRQKNLETFYPTNTFHIISTSNAVASTPVASWVEKVPTAEVSQILRGPSTTRLAKNARRSAQDDDFGEGIKREHYSRSCPATPQNRSRLEPLWRLAAGDVAHSVGSQEVQIEVVA